MRSVRAGEADKREAQILPGFQYLPQPDLWTYHQLEASLGLQCHSLSC